MLVSGHSEDLEADLARYYPRDADQFAAFLAGDMSVRRLYVLASRLPHGSATYAVRAGGRARADWTEQVELLAEAVEELRLLHLTYVRANTDPKKKHQIPDDIERVPRPSAPDSA